MTKPTVSADLDEPFDVERHLASQISLYPSLQLLADDVAQLAHLSIAEILGANIWRDRGQLQEPLRSGRPDAVDVGEGDLDPLVPRDVHPGYSCHLAPEPPLLPVFVSAVAVFVSTLPVGVPAVPVFVSAIPGVACASGSRR